jgi:quercetin dioxygenase-like cupin family protein
VTIINLQAESVQPIEAYESFAAWSSEIASGLGEAHLHVVRMEAGGVIGPHEAGFGQLFLVVSGVGWAAGPDGEHRVLVPGQAAYIRRSELHSKGAESALIALIVQVRELALHRPK